MSYQKEIEKAVSEELKRLYEAEEGEQTPENETQPEQTGDDIEDTDDSGGENEIEKKDETEEEDFSAADFGDFLKKTDTTVTVKKIGTMPSPIFGTGDTNNHNKYRVTVKNENGTVSFTFWDSINNTKNNTPLNMDDAFAAFGRDVEAIQTAPSFQEFKETFGYTETDETIAQKAFNGCRKQLDKAKKMFDEPQLKELQRLAREY